jgi:hypothetical protein
MSSVFVLLKSDLARALRHADDECRVGIHRGVDQGGEALAEARGVLLHARVNLIGVGTHPEQARKHRLVPLTTRQGELGQVRRVQLVADDMRSHFSVERVLLFVHRHGWARVQVLGRERGWET